MQNLSNTKFLRMTTKLLILLLIAKAIAVFIYLYLPTEGIQLSCAKSYRSVYQRVDFKNMLKRVDFKNMPQERRSNTIAYSINSLLLKGLYGSRFNGFVIVAKKVSPKNTTIVSIGEYYAGYKLKEIALREVVFSKLEKDFVLRLTDIETYNNPAPRSKDLQLTRTQRSVTKKDIEKYSNNPSDIWKDIAISPLKKGSKIIGFHVIRIREGSKMAELGLKKGDLIISVNNIKLTSFKDALSFYKKIDTIKTISLIVLRNNQEREIIYEIH
ncbi:PDZ domain-containing protein [Sulfurimonas sp. SAG-AH-194-C20]|nr:PDZ domain-containing protein [Sulfurimonas sp. SAG-AH-194-C20]MDF1878181.1 PDZ domain-containing protein [Sulfurimonas sp. SAG-AH-194-C20]